MSNNSEDISANLALKWVIHKGRLALTSRGKVTAVTANEVVRIEHKGENLSSFPSLTSKPSEEIKNLKINRFPAKLTLLLQTPTVNSLNPILKVTISAGRWSDSLTTMPNHDQFITGDQWFSLILDNIYSLIDILSTCNIDSLGTITLKQALNLMTTETSGYLKIAEIDERLHPSQVEKHDSEIEHTLSTLGFNATLYPYQKTGISWLNSISENGLGCILADEMGLGKTLQIIAILTLYKKRWGLLSLVIAPATLLENWKREFSKFSANVRVLIHSGSHRTGFPSKLLDYEVIITSYETAVRDQGMFGMVDWGFIILDEAQAIKNPEAKRSMVIKSFNRKSSIAVTGTPVENRLLDLWSLMDFSCSGLLGSREYFESNFNDNTSSAARLELVVSPLLLRRQVADVAQDLPEKIIIPQAVNMRDEEVAEYEALRRDIAEKYAKSAGLVTLIKLRQFCTHPSILEDIIDVNPEPRSDKYKRLIEIIEEIVSQKEKVIIFTSFTRMSDLLVNDIPRRFHIHCKQIDGRTPITDRQIIIDQFSNYPGSGMLVLNPKAAGTGLNITAANHVIHYNLEWNPAVEDQATARAFRRGQERPVTVHRLFYPDTIEEVINDRIERKRLLADVAVIGTEAAEANTADIARALSISPANKY